jgi:hypothetical protein
LIIGKMKKRANGIGYASKQSALLKRLAAKIEGSPGFKPPVMLFRENAGRIEFVPRFVNFFSYIAFLVLAEAAGQLEERFCLNPECGKILSGRQGEKTCGSTCRKVLSRLKVRAQNRNDLPRLVRKPNEMNSKIPYRSQR